MKNALTFDIEEYFHAEVFASALRPEEWPGLASRVVDTTERLDELWDQCIIRGIPLARSIHREVAERHHVELVDRSVGPAVHLSSQL